jgi:hypothetical protein
MNYFSTAGPKEYGYIRFISGSFIFISGYIISMFYVGKFKFDRGGTTRRLVMRGLKLFILFSGLNILINLTGIGNPAKAPLGIQQYINNLSTIYISGDIKYAAFLILLPISYLLMISPIILQFSNSRILLNVTILLIVFSLTLYNIQWNNLNLGMIGMIGLSVGIGIDGIGKSFAMKSRVSIILGLIIMILMMGYLDRNILTYSLGVMIVLKLIYDFAMTLNSEMKYFQGIILVGQYSLVCYIMQIIILQGLSRVLDKKRWGLGYETILIFILTNIFILALCALLKYLRNQYGFIDKSYRFVFS